MDKLPLDPGITKKTTIGSEEYIEVLSYLEDLRKLCDKVCYHVDKDVCDCFEKLKEEILGMLKEE